MTNPTNSSTVTFTAKFPTNRDPYSDYKAWQAFADRYFDLATDDVVVNERKRTVTWTEAWSEYLVQSRIENVGYYGSAPQGPASRKATVTFSIDGGDARTVTALGYL